MGELLSYSLATSLTLIALYLPYKWLLAGEKQPALNRLTLLGIYAVGLTAVPAATWLRSLGDGGDGTPGIDIARLILMGAETGADTPHGVSLWTVALWVYTCGVVASAVWTVVTLLRLKAVMDATVPEVTDGTTVRVSPDPNIAPFSLGGRIVISRIDVDTPGTPLILAHERVHVRLRHWLDLAVGHAVCLLQWYNPAAWLMVRELRAVHEFQADAGAIASGINIKEYQMLLIRKAVGVRFPSFANSLNHSNLKTRITMMYSSSPRGARRLRALALVPALGAALFVTHLPSVASALAGASEATLSTPSAVSEGKVSENPAPAQAAPATAVAEEDRPFDAVEEMPRYPGGMKALLNDLMGAVVYPEDAMRDNVQGRVIVKFVVGKDGSVSSPEIVRSVSPSLDKAAMDAVLSLARFTPGRLKGKPVSVYYCVPVQFRLEDDTPAKKDTGLTVTLRNERGESTTTSSGKSPVILIDGKVCTAEELGAIPPARIEKITITRDDPAHPEGVITVTLKDS